jgi:dienelactone hydrolase
MIFKAFTSLVFVASLFASSTLDKCPFKAIGYGCCKNSKTEIVFTDSFGNYGVEKGKRCGIIDDSCWSLKYGYLCCNSDSTSVVKTNKYGNWGKENGKWCGIKDQSEVEEEEDSDYEESQTVNSLMLDQGGSGPYKAVMTQQEGLPDFTIYRPENLKEAVDAEGRLPVILFGNGGCGRISFSYGNFLTELASYGYVVAAVGPWVGEDNTDYLSLSLDFSEETINGFKADANSLIDVALSWLEKENKERTSIFYKTLNTNKVSAMGQSCGGLQALIISTKNDKRIKTTVALNSGANSPGDLLDSLIVKDELQKLTQPIIYIIGGEEDIAHYNALDDFSLIKKVPVAVACKADAGHMGTYSEPNGGTFGKMTLAWLDYILKNDKSHDALFRKSIIESELEGWTIQQKNF